MKITGEIRLRRVANDKRGGLFVLTHPIIVECNGETYTAPPGAIVNGASIPWLFKWLLPPWHSDYDIASVIHDVLVGENGRRPTLDWKSSAQVCADIMKFQGAPGWKVKIFKFCILQWRHFKRWF